ncbi:hypothetical protein M0R45_026432 [Rubus argutus]|uniref:Uncharacterized protein n=1 Tax=Rubus argutus TaxID=59490 RepID=A0AAW1WX13_RUBAR
MGSGLEGSKCDSDGGDWKWEPGRRRKEANSNGNLGARWCLAKWWCEADAGLGDSGDAWATRDELGLNWRWNCELMWCGEIAEHWGWNSWWNPGRVEAWVWLVK